MINFIVGFLVGGALLFIAGLLLGWFNRQVFDAVVSMKKTDISPPFVTTTNPSFTHEDMAGQSDDSVIVTTKSPQLLAWEEDEKLRKMNLRPR